MEQLSFLQSNLDQTEISPSSGETHLVQAESRLEALKLNLGGKMPGTEAWRNAAVALNEAMECYLAMFDEIYRGSDRVIPFPSKERMEMYKKVRLALETRDALETKKAKKNSGN